MNPLKSLNKYGQAVWLDFLARRFVADGGLKKLIEEDGLSGVTSNPTIFKKAIAGTAEYDPAIAKIVGASDCDAMALYEQLAVEDIQNAADVLRPVYERTKRTDGYVSLEVSPYLAHDTAQTIAEARRLWNWVGRENLMIKVPGTEAGLPAIRQLIGEGINVNITLLFSRGMYGETVEAYLAGLELFVANGGDASRVASVASFFVSRIDTAIDNLIDEKLAALAPSTDTEAFGNLRGQIAIANAKLAYQDYRRLFSGARWEKLRAAGAREQRLLWASTGTKNPAYPDTLYIDELIGANTVNTVPPETMDAFRDHGEARASLEENVVAAQASLMMLEQSGISLDTVTAKLAIEGVALFADAFDDLLAAVEKKRAACLGTALNRQSVALSSEQKNAVNAALNDWRKHGNVRRLWRRDASLWTGADEAKWLGWLDIPEQMRADVKRLQYLAADARRGNFTHAVLLGMGGSSLGAEVFAKCFGPQAGSPKLLVLDSTSPEAIQTVESAIDIARTLFIVSSKSGTTLEPNILKDYFYARVEAALGAGMAGAHFIAITDPGSKLASAATTEQFCQICLGRADIGGRYSVLSDFGLVPAAIMGIDMERFLNAAAKMVFSCGAHVPPQENPGVVLGVVLGTLANEGRDKITIIASPAISEMGAWLEQLIAESTGKHGKGLIPVDIEPPGRVETYGNDRVFVYLRLDEAGDHAQDALAESLERAGQPVVRISIASRYEIGQEFFRWEIATAVASAVLGVNPFDQPDVERSKIKTRELMQEFGKAGSRGDERAFFEGNGIALFADQANAEVLALATDEMSLPGILKAHIERAGAGDYVALLAYVAQNESYQQPLQDMRRMIRDTKHVATCLGFGPRFLHSTGQAYKGGPDSGVFIQITADHAADIPVPGRAYSFGAVLDATADGDFAVLNDRERRALRVHLTSDIHGGLATLRSALEVALGT